MKRSLIALLATVSVAAFAQAPDEETITEAYIYLLGRALVIRQEHIDLSEKGVTYNRIKYNPLGSADFVNPNLDVAYLEAWFAADDKTPVVLKVPEVKGRYYTANPKRGGRADRKHQRAHLSHEALRQVHLGQAGLEGEDASRHGPYRAAFNQGQDGGAGGAER